MTNTKRFNPGAAKAAALKKDREPLIEPTENDITWNDLDNDGAVGESIESSEIGSQNQSPESDLDKTCLDIIQSLKDSQEQVLLDLETQIELLSEDFTNRAVAIVKRGTQACFLEAAVRIRELKLSDLITNSGETLEGVVSPLAMPPGTGIALPGSTTDGAIE